MVEGVECELVNYGELGELVNYGLLLGAFPVGERSAPPSSGVMSAKPGTQPYAANAATPFPHGGRHLVPVGRLLPHGLGFSPAWFGFQPSGFSRQVGFQPHG